MELEATHHTLDLANEGLLSIRHGQSARIRCNTGMLWITEEGEVKDTILSAGDTYTIRHPGLTLLTSFGSSRVTIEGSADRVRTGRTASGDVPELASCA
ncbi:MAG TPA: DUF2917 domain-containing protein [Burkholderiales bacterium]|jgi:hypothetical protein